MIKVSDSLFEAIYNDEILQEIEQTCGSFQQHHVELTASTEAMLNLIDNLRVKKSRRGEVVMVIPNEHDHIWLHTKAFYPHGVYRLMTGGLDIGEVPHEALHREVFEETGFDAEIDRCLAVITYTLKGSDGYLPFASYLFLTRPIRGRPRPTDPNEAITGFKAVPTKKLPDIARQLRSLEGRFLDWGIFRAVAHKVAGEYLNNVQRPYHNNKQHSRDDQHTT